MRILVLNWLDRENPQAGGAEVHLHESFGRLVRDGCAVTLIASGWRGAPSLVELDGIEVHRVGGRHTFPLRAAPKARRIAASGRFDLVIEDLNKVPLLLPAWTPTRCLLLVHHLFGKTAFQEASLPFAAATWLLERPLPLVYRGVPVVAVSESTREDLVRRGLPRESIDVVENGVDIERYRPGHRSGRFPDPTVLYLGRLKRYKRVDLVIEAVARLRQEGLRTTLLIAGKGDHRTALERKARDLGLGPDAVRFLGFVAHNEKLELLQRAWVHSLTSPKEGWGISNLEAAACATPTVASDAPGLRDSVMDGDTGFLVPHGDVDALTRSLRLLLQDAKLRRAMGEAGRRFAERLSWDRTSARLRRVLEAAVASS